MEESDKEVEGEVSYRLLFSSVTPLLRAFHLGPEDAEDVLQEAALALLAAHTKPRNPKAFFIACARNRCLIQARR